MVNKGGVWGGIGSGGGGLDDEREKIIVVIQMGIFIIYIILDTFINLDILFNNLFFYIMCF